MKGTYLNASETATPPPVTIRFMGRVVFRTLAANSRTTLAPFVLPTTDLMFIINR